MNHWGESDDESLPDWMNPKKCHQFNEQKEQRRKTGKDLNSVIEDCLKKPPVHVIIESPTE